MNDEPNHELETGCFATVAGIVQHVQHRENGWTTVLVEIPPEDVNLLDLPQEPPASWSPTHTR